MDVIDSTNLHPFQVHQPGDLLKIHLHVADAAPPHTGLFFSSRLNHNGLLPPKLHPLPRRF